MEWNVYIGDVNRGTIESYNVFRHASYVRDLAGILSDIEKKSALSDTEKKEAFAEEVRRYTMYYFWAKCEWEVIIDHWPSCDNDKYKSKKVDVFDQLRLNWDKFIDYVWTNRKALKVLGKKK